MPNPSPTPRQHFNSRPSARGDEAQDAQEEGRKISIHAPPRGATLFSISCGLSGKFQFTPLREGRPLSRCGKCAARRHFNSRPSARGDRMFRPKTPLCLISIHAPPRGATPRHAGRIHPRQFQFTPLREGRQKVVVSSRLPIDFNSRPSARGDVILSRQSAKTKFQFTPLREGRHAELLARFQPPVFQFTPLREGRPAIVNFLSSVGYFNSRPSARGDKVAVHATIFFKAFQFTPLREGRRDAAEIRRQLYISIHAPPRGATGSPRRARRRTKNFNSRPSARGDSKRYAISANLLFNPYKSAWLNNNATQFVEIILVIFHRIIA